MLHYFLPRPTEQCLNSAPKIYLSLGTFHISAQLIQLFTVLKGEIFKSLKKAVPALSCIGGNISSDLAFLAISDFRFPIAVHNWKFWVLLIGNHSRIWKSPLTLNIAVWVKTGSRYRTSKAVSVENRNCCKRKFSPFRKLLCIAAFYNFLQRR